jgi:hypothetical protein
VEQANRQGVREISRSFNLKNARREVSLKSSLVHVGVEGGNAVQKSN